MVLRTACSTLTTLIQRNPKTPSYFTQIIYYAFLRRIQKEKKQMEIKTKIIERSGYDEVMHTDRYEGNMSGMNASYSDMGSIENIEIKMNR